MGRGRHRRHDAHLLRPGHPPGADARRLPGDPQAPAATWCSPGPRSPRSPAARRPRRPGRDLERHAVLLAAVGPGPHDHRCSTTSTPRCGAWCCRRALAPLGELARAPRRARRSTAAAGGHAVGVVATEIIDDLGFPADRITVVPPGIDPRFTPGRAPAPRARSSSAVGRLMPVKRFDELIRACAEVAPASSRTCTLTIVGNGYERDELDSPGRRMRNAQTGSRFAGRVVRRRADRPLPRGLAGGQRLGPRGLGHDPHRGGRLRHAGRRHAHRRPHRRGRRRPQRAAGRRRARAGRRHRPGLRRRCAVRQRSPRAPASTRPRFTWDATARRRAHGARRRGPCGARTGAAPAAGDDPSRSLAPARPRDGHRTRPSRSLAYVPLLLTKPGRSAPTPRPTCTSTRAGCWPGASRCGTPRSAWAPSPTRTSATSGRWAPSTGCCDADRRARLGGPAHLARHADVRRRRRASATCSAPWAGTGVRPSPSPRSSTCSARTCSTTPPASR